MTKVLVKLNKIALDFGSYLLFDTDELEIKESSRIGLIGENGAGKSSLARLILEEIKPTQGHIQLNTNNIGYLEQVSDNIPYDFNFDGRLLSELNIPYGTTEFSGGELSKLSILEVFSSHYDLLILDEPTSHLDKEGIEFLIRTIKNYDGATLIISHDRRLLNECVNEVWSIEEQSIHVFSGNYDDYKREIEKERESLYHQKEIQDKEIKRLEASISDAKIHAEKILIGRKGADHRSLSSRMTKEKGTVQKGIMQSAKNMQNRIDSMEEIKLPEEKVLPIFEEADIKTDHNRFPIIFNYIDITAGNKLLIESLNLQISRGTITALKGNNGTGKTTIIEYVKEAFNNKLDIITFSKNAELGFYNQLSYLEFKHRTEPLLEYVSKHTSVSKYLLKEMLKDLKFTDNDFERSISTLSGGEAVRVSLFLTLISGNNVLILDEPTNYLDIDTINVLETYLNTYPGTVLLTSHDEEFLENVADEVYKIENKKLKKIK